MGIFLHLLNLEMRFWGCRKFLVVCSYFYISVALFTEGTSSFIHRGTSSFLQRGNIPLAPFKGGVGYFTVILTLPQWSSRAMGMRVLVS